MQLTDDGVKTLTNNDTAWEGIAYSLDTGW
jgi:hypothetical protein